MAKKAPYGSEKRKYVRMDSVLPVQFRFISTDGKAFLSEWLQGFTNNIGKGGICLMVNNLPADLGLLASARQAKLSLSIELPFIRDVVPAKARIAWVESSQNKHLIGLAYEDILPGHNRKIMRYALTKKLFPLFSLVLIGILVLGFAINALVNVKLTNGNKALVEQMVKVTQDSGLAKQKIKEISKERQELELKMYALQFRMQSLAEEKEKGEKSKSAVIGKLNSMLSKLSGERSKLQQQLVTLQSKESSVSQELSRLDKERTQLEKATIDNMYKWLLVHQNQRTGLVISFEGDDGMQNWAFTYDQALAAQAYTQFSDFDRARKIFSFFQKQANNSDGMFFNAYYANDGSPAEYTVHSGPNIWLGIAILQYTQRSEDYGYLGLAKNIAEAVIKLQALDPEGGIKGGPQTEWFATEHNLDAYAFFNMLYGATGDIRYGKARDKALNWLLKYTYARDDVPVKRGKGDATIATDTYAWSIAAVGPEKLQEIGMDPEKIMEFAEKNCAAEVFYVRPDGKVVKIKGFDFAPKAHVARGGVVSSEWTAQMVLAFKIMADFYRRNNMAAKSDSYIFKAETYMSSLSKMIIYSPSPSGQGGSCLPYATQDNADTGHGWFTPKGSSTGSVAGTAYTIFAYYGYNPLELRQWPQD